jgi:hypothetical protein
VYCMAYKKSNFESNIEQHLPRHMLGYPQGRMGLAPLPFSFFLADLVDFKGGLFRHSQTGLVPGDLYGSLCSRTSENCKKDLFSYVHNI